jgi:hypothetical protein
MVSFSAREEPKSLSEIESGVNRLNEFAKEQGMDLHAGHIDRECPEKTVEGAINVNHIAQFLNFQPRTLSLVTALVIGNDEPAL